MKEESVWRQYAALPPELQKQVADFIAFLQTRQVPVRAVKTSKRGRLAKEPFVGMWCDREDLQNSSAWVRAARQNEWMSRHE